MARSLPSLFTMLNELIGRPSISSTSPEFDQSNRQVIDKLAEWLQQLGFSVEIIPLPSQPGKANLIASYGSGPGGLVLAGHTDTVPYDEALWQTNPFALTEKDNRWYGLGATDMKGFFPVALEAAQRCIDQDFKQPLIVLATADEESSMEGARLLTTLGKPRARYAVIGEPTDLKPIRSHKGIMMEAIRVEGKAGHSSNPELGRNAMEIMNDVITSLLTYRESLQKRYNNPLFDVSYPTLNLGCIHGGDSPNRICSHCEVTFDLRLLPGINSQEVRAELLQQTRVLADKHSVPINLRSLIDGVEPFEQDSASALVQATEKLTGHVAGTTAFATEGPFLQELGMDTVILGPGSINQAHQPDEYMELNQVNPAIDIIETLIRQFCLH
jgi:acetylornithine deacetylase